MDIGRFEYLKRQIDHLKQEKARAEGRRDLILSELQKKYQCTTLKDVIKLGKKLSAEADAAEQKFAAQLQQFEERWSGLLKDI